jgi:hypothetical protein
MTAPGEPPASPLPDPIPVEVRQSPRVHLPCQDLLYRGPYEALVAPVDPAGDQQTASLCWPQDHAWCVATEIDLPWTYVAGPAGLIESVAADARLEALPAGPHDPLTRIEDWITRWAHQPTADLFAAGEATIARRCGIRTAEQSGLHRPAPERLDYRVDGVRASDSNDRLGQRRESSHL